jgi:hypothetical protein
MQQRSSGQGICICVVGIRVSAAPDGEGVAGTLVEEMFMVEEAITLSSHDAPGLAWVQLPTGKLLCRDLSLSSASR